MPIPVDAEGLRVDELIASDAAAVVVTPAHQFPTGAILSPARRAALVEWAEREELLIIEDDFDAEYRYDRAAVGALQGLAPERVLYIGSASKRLTPGMRLGWMLTPSWLAWQISAAKAVHDGGSEVVGQLALRDFIVRGELDRHVRRMRTNLPAPARSAAGSARPPPARGARERRGRRPLRAGHIARRRRRARAAQDRRDPRGGHGGPLPGTASPPAAPPGVLLGFGNLSEPAIEQGVRLLADAYAAVR